MKEDDINEGFWVFVSHSTKDFERVRLVRNALEDSGFRPILFYLKCLENETEVNDLLKREIDARKRFILCDSPNAQASKFVQSEVEYIRSKNRMYEIVDLSKIDMGSQDAEKEVIELIKPFRKRTNVFVCCAHEDSSLAELVKGELRLQGFSVADIPLLDSQCLYQKVSQVIETTLSNGYFLYLIGKSVSHFCQAELDIANEIAPNMVLPVVINEQGGKNKDWNYVNVSIIRTDEDKAKAIVDALIDFDLKNNK